MLSLQRSPENEKPAGSVTTLCRRSMPWSNVCPEMGTLPGAGQGQGVVGAAANPPPRTTGGLSTGRGTLSGRNCAPNRTAATCADL